MTTPVTASSFAQRAQDTFVSLQFAWALGHLVTVLSTIWYFLSYFNASSASGHYTRAFLGAFASYAVVVYKTFGIPQITPAFAQKFLSNENVQYLILTVIWMMSPIYSVATIPYFIFSLFHLLNYVRVHLLPVVFPELKTASPASPAAAQTGLAHKISRALNSVIVVNNPIALYYVAYFEIVAVMGSLLIGVLSFKSIFAPLFYAQFLRLRYHLSPHTRRAFADIRARLDAIAIGQNGAPSKVPPFVAKGYVIARDALTTFGASAVRTEPGPRN